MFQYRQVLMRMRQGESDRDIARAKARGSAQGHRVPAGWQQSKDGSRRKRRCRTMPRLRHAWRHPSAGAAPYPDAEPYRTVVERWVEQDVGAVAIHAALRREHGFTGSVFGHPPDGRRHPRSAATRATVRLSLDPGEAAQVDFGAGPFLVDPNGQRRRAWCFVMTLCFSRHQYIEFVFDQSTPTWLGCHRRAFEWFGAVPRRVIIDNAKCAITRACIRDPEVQRSYADCAEAYGFKIDACPPADPQKKGIVESGVKYMKRNFLPTRTFRSLADLNEQGRRWVLDEAGQRIHGTTRQRPIASVRAGAAAAVGVALGHSGAGQLVSCDPASRLPRQVPVRVLLGAIQSRRPDALAARHRPHHRTVPGLPPRRDARPHVPSW
jgi:hypothetical protein